MKMSALCSFLNGLGLYKWAANRDENIIQFWSITRGRALQLALTAALLISCGIHRKFQPEVTLRCCLDP
jgi:hypothetical protein